MATTKRRMTQAEVLRQIKATGATGRIKDGEWRVNVPGGTEETAYYTDDPQDALDTAVAMMTRHASR